MLHDRGGQPGRAERLSPSAIAVLADDLDEHGATPFVPCLGVCERLFYRGYEAEAGHALDRDRVPYWELAATIRWAVIALDQAERHRSGAERSLELALTGHIVRELEMDVLRMTGDG